MDVPQPMALFIWHNTQTLVSSPVSVPVITLWSDHTSPLLPLLALSTAVLHGADSDRQEIRVLRNWWRLAALVFWSSDTSVFLLVQMRVWFVGEGSMLMLFVVILICWMWYKMMWFIERGWGFIIYFSIEHSNCICTCALVIFTVMSHNAAFKHWSCGPHWKQYLKIWR